MVVNGLALTSLKYLSMRGFEHHVKGCKKFLNVFFSQSQSKYFREFSTENNIDVLDTIQMQKYLNFLANVDSHHSYQTNEQVMKLLKDKINVEEEIKTLENMSSEGDKELEKLIETEKKKYLETIKEIKNNLFHSLILIDDENDNRNVELRIDSGIGGEESKLFSGELLQMYINYANYKNWECNKCDDFLLINGELAFGHLKHEAGVHRVQRVPETEKAGRTHTSTCSVIVLPQPKSHEIQISNKDLIIEKTKSSGPGGQNVNKRETCVRIKHIPTGIVIENQKERYQYANLKEAINRLRSTLYNMEQEKIFKERKTMKMEQAGINDYSDKIRTYHYPSNRVTDHRINYSMHNLRSFLEGNKELDDLIKRIKEFIKKKELLLHVENILKSEEYKNFEKHQTR